MDASGALRDRQRDPSSFSDSLNPFVNLLADPCRRLEIVCVQLQEQGQQAKVDCGGGRRPAEQIGKPLSGQDRVAEHLQGGQEQHSRPGLAKCSGQVADTLDAALPEKLDQPRRHQRPHRHEDQFARRCVSMFGHDLSDEGRRHRQQLHEGQGEEDTHERREP